MCSGGDGFQEDGNGNQRVARFILIVVIVIAIAWLICVARV